MIAVFASSTKVKLRFVGWLAYDCLECRLVQPFRAYHRTTQVYLEGLPMEKPKPLDDLLVCDFCEASYPIALGQLDGADKAWTHRDGINALAASTNHSMIERAETQTFGQWQFDCLLSKVQAGVTRGRRLSVPSVAGACSAAVALATGIVVTSLMDRQGQPNLALSGAGAVAGGLAGAWLARTLSLVVAKYRARKYLSQRLEHYPISIHELMDCCGASPRRWPDCRSILEAAALPLTDTALYARDYRQSTSE